MSLLSGLLLNSLLGDIMDCLECRVTFECHSELNKDIKALTDLEKLISRGMINQAMQDCSLLIARFQNRNNKITGEINTTLL
jgi:hypothetical protein